MDYEISDSFFDESDLTRITTTLRAIKKAGQVFEVYKRARDNYAAMAYLKTIFPEVADKYPVPVECLLSDDESQRADHIREELR